MFGVLAAARCRLPRWSWSSGASEAGYDRLVLLVDRGLVAVVSVRPCEAACLDTAGRGRRPLRPLARRLSRPAPSPGTGWAARWPGTSRRGCERQADKQEGSKRMGANSGGSKRSRFGYPRQPMTVMDPAIESHYGTGYERSRLFPGGEAIAGVRQVDGVAGTVVAPAARAAAGCRRRPGAACREVAAGAGDDRALRPDNPRGTARRQAALAGRPQKSSN